MANPKGKKTIGICVNESYEFKGAEMRDEIDAFFQYVVDNAPELVLDYPKLKTIKKVLGEW